MINTKERKKVNTKSNKKIIQLLLSRRRPKMSIKLTYFFLYSTLKQG